MAVNSQWGDGAMRMHIVTGTPFTVKCVNCGVRVLAGGSFTSHGANEVPFGTQRPVYADLDGKPFVDYYCEPCKERVSARQ